MNYWYRERFHSTLLFLYWKRESLVITPWWFQKSILFGFRMWWERARSTHIYTHVPSRPPKAQPSLAAPRLHGSLQERGGAWSPQQVRERWVDFSHFQSTLHRKGHINTSEFKSKWIFWYHLYVTPFHNKEEIHVTSIKVKKKKKNSGNGCVYEALNIKILVTQTCFITHLQANTCPVL